ncbi:hypothetical protein K4K60_003088 [Colletotrichum sp. SAR11_57]|nr:hypothetical protein K4K60_003088 [Colletotrichum sp. SAR11_57]
MNIHQQDQHNYQADGKRHNTTNADDATGRPGLLGRLGDFAGFLLRHWRMAISAVLLCLLSPANRKLCLNEEYRLIARNIPRVADLCAGLPSSTAVLGDAAFPPFCRTFPAIKGSHVSTSVAAIAREIVVLGDMELADVAKGDGVWKNVFTDTHRIDRNLRRTNEAYEKQRTTTYRALHRLNRRIKIEIARMEEPVSGWYAWTPDWLAVLWTGRRDQAVTLNLLDELESLAMDARTQRKAHWDDLHASGLGAGDFDAGDFDAGDFDAVVGDLRSFATDIAVEKKSLAVRGDADGDHDGDDEDVEKRRAAADPSEAGVGMVRQVMLDVSAAHSAFLVSLDREIHHLGELIEMTIPTLRGKGRDAYGKRQVPKKIADICAIETALVSHVPLHEQPPTFFELLGLDPYNQPFSPPGSSTQRGAAGAAKAAAAEKLIKEAWLRLVEDVDKTYISVEIIGERGARESTESGVTQFISYKDVRSKVKLERLSADTEALRRLYNQVAQLLLDPGFRSTYMHYLMPGEQLYKSEIKKDLQQGWVHNRRAKMGEVCGWDEGDGQK